MLAWAPSGVNATNAEDGTGEGPCPQRNKGGLVADIKIEDGIIKIGQLDIQDPKAAAVLAAYPQVRWAEITRRALKIGLGYMKGGEKD
jgi:hypothetical protein